ncbi:hypothetical protein R1flu_025672 [Riccia fluitans]|uniref:Uncharacterized protein n=1 Tax=Riccia fluitans TaxID=41844 RepID=A0ABD1XYE6_9MARC
MWRSAMDAFVSMSDDELPFSDESSSIESDVEEEDEDDYMWTLLPDMTQTPDSTADTKCATFQPHSRIQMDNGNESTCSGFSMDGNWLAVGTSNGPVQVRIYDASTYKVIQILSGG